jgi:hypothetical protein
MEDFVTVTLFLIIFGAIVVVVVLAAIEAYDRITGADAKRQAQLERLRRLDDEEDY